MKAQLIAIYDGLTCCFCGENMPKDAIRHPPSLEFVNGYPTACRKIGQALYRVNEEDDLPWLRIRAHLTWSNLVNRSEAGEDEKGL